MFRHTNPIRADSPVFNASASTSQYGERSPIRSTTWTAQRQTSPSTAAIGEAGAGT
jgi:hypothetical protein